MSAVVRQPMRRVRACARFDDGALTGARFCAACGFARALHARLVPCSQCGGDFAAPANGDRGYSMCIDHRGK